MRLLTLSIAVSLAALAAGCERSAEPRTGNANAPVSASGGATTGGGLTTGPKGERIEQPSAPPQTAQSAKDVKPDPGDANDHSNPRHDSKAKTSGD